MENPRDLVERQSRKRRDSFGMLDGLDEDRSSCSTESSGGSGASSPEDSEDEELGGGGVTQLNPSSSLTLIKTNGQVYTYPDGKAGMGQFTSRIRTWLSESVDLRPQLLSLCSPQRPVRCAAWSASETPSTAKPNVSAASRGKPPTKKAKVLQKQPLMTKLAAYAQQQANQQGGVKKSVSMELFDWGRYLGDGDVMGAPVSCFQHVPMGKSWGGISEGIRVEVPNTDSGLPMKVYWIAGIIKLAGTHTHTHTHTDTHTRAEAQTALSSAHPEAPLIQLLIRSLLLVQFISIICSNVIPTFVSSQVIGGRLRLVYEECDDGTDDFWCHMYSPLIHSIGWSRSIGHRFKRSDVSKKLDGQMDAPGQLFAKVKEVDQSGHWFEDGMKLEAIDPLNLSAICVATVRKVLADGYLMIGIDGSEAADGSDWFCYHSTSPSIFPAGFCEINNIELTPPRGYSSLPFRWFEYLKESKSVAAPVNLFNRDVPNHGFRPGMKLEAVDLMEPRLVCVATVTRIVHRLLRIHFDGWEDEYDQWVDCESPDLYPVGWCQLTGYQLQPPASAASKQRKKSQQYKGQKKKRKLPIAKRPVSLSGTMVTGVPRSLSGDENETPPDYPSPPPPASAAQPPSADLESSPRTEGGAGMHSCSLLSFLWFLQIWAS
uniref:MBT domain-containing protein 1-like n=1 Tax=Neolamprologus brichardi TaxID=32507 RepID=A0A3Q4HUH1_NEOBR